MKTNLIFKKTTKVNNIPRTVTRIVSVDVPSICSEDGWTLAGSADIVEVLESTPNVCILPDLSNVTTGSNNLEESDVRKFQSDVPGTARLVRSKGVIKIVARKGKTVKNQTTPDSVCISDTDKTRFFKHCRETYGYQTQLFEFKANTSEYDFWNKFIDTEYNTQRSRYIKKGGN